MGLKSKLAFRVLNSKLGSVSRDKKVFNLETAKSAGVLWEFDQKEVFDRFAKQLTEAGIKVVDLCYLPLKKAIVPEGINGFTKKETGWNEVPKSEVAEQFINQKFDMLIDLTGQRYFPVVYLTALSKAAFKIGYSGTQANYFDLNIEFGETPEAAQLAEQILYYLKRINKTTIE